MVEGTINSEQFSKFIESIVNMIVIINNNLTDNVLSATEEGITIKLGAFVEATNAVEVLCKNLLELAGLPQLEYKDIDLAEPNEE